MQWYAYLLIVVAVLILAGASLLAPRLRRRPPAPPVPAPERVPGAAPGDWRRSRPRVADPAGGRLGCWQGVGRSGWGTPPPGGKCPRVLVGEGRAGVLGAADAFRAGARRTEWPAAISTRAILPQVV